VGGFRPPPNPENIEATTTTLEGEIVHPKLFKMRSATLADDVI